MKNQKLINFLNQELSNFNVMYVKLHRYHWFIQGHHFFGLHAQFETLYKEFAADLDTIAERILAIGGKPLATLTKYVDESTIKEATADDKETEIITQLHKDYNQLIHEIVEEGMPLARELNDEPTLDLLIGLQAKFEKHVWMLRSFLAYE
ncbi:DNA starvation/stationary phase protection protein [Pullulanibacillus camelliae]|uniref:DNA starvation/stationary phase protection protein n=1 Tax=Pullulanibacillus camelliae TaxID=1707096 RepID=A0A8J2YKK1_9BACL|nr:Dps family protein [Pullulanibacillus camelliae]GGE50157.1 DNA starvation/stationary phase protection protein [Pullulanibacillus camelliae]